MTHYIKLARPDGYDFHTGKTINYRDAVDGVAEAPDFIRDGQCGRGIHICRRANDCFAGGATIPCSAYIVEPVGRVSRIDSQKVKARAVHVLEEVQDLDALFGWRYSEALAPIHPLRLGKQQPTPEHIALLKKWASVRGSMRDSVWDSVRASVWDSVRASVWALVWNSVWESVGASVRGSMRDSMRDSVWDSVWDSVRASVWDSVRAYTGSLFPNVKDWKCVEHKRGEYPFQSGADLWRAGFVPTFDGSAWRLHSGRKATVVYQG